MQLIFEQLMTKSANYRYINRYIRFIQTRSNVGSHKHHILPKATDMYPEYKSFSDYPWNMIRLTYREHFIAHKMLAKIFPKSSQSRCFYYMLNKQGNNSKIYHMLLSEQKSYLKGNTHKLGKKESPETRAKKSESQKGRLLGKKIGLGNKSRTGQKQSTEERLKKSLALKGNQNAKGSKSHKANLGRRWYHNPTTNEKRMFGKEPIPEGFLTGMGSKNYRVPV